MVIDLFTGKEIPPDPKLTITQSLEKTTDVISCKQIDFENSENNNWEEILQDNEVLTPIEIITQFQLVLMRFLSNQNIKPEYCKFMLEQCKNWNITDQFVTTE